MRSSSLGRALLLSALAGSFVMAAGPAAMAQATDPATQSPEGIVLASTGLISADLGEATLGNSPESPVTGSGITGLLDLGTGNGVLTATAQDTTSPPGNSATAEVGQLGPSSDLLNLTLFGNLISATVVKSSCQWNSTVGTGDGAFTLGTTIASLSILGATVPVADLASIAPNTNVTSLPGFTMPTLPSVPLLGAITGLTVTLNQQELGPGTNSMTVNAIDVDLTSTIPALNGSVEIDVASSTCGAPASTVASPVVSGKGLGIGLGMLGVAGVGFAAVYMRRRHVLAA
jgi:hypothetical protein